VESVISEMGGITAGVVTAQDGNSAAIESQACWADVRRARGRRMRRRLGDFIVEKGIL
jgi:hypothetical protein